MGRGGFEPPTCLLAPLANRHTEGLLTGLPTSNQPPMPRTFSPEEAVERYLREREPELSDSSLYNHRSSLRQFLEFCDQEEIERINDIDAFLISDYRLQRQNEVTETTVYNNVSHLRIFIRWCESRDLIEKDIAESMILPDLGDNARSEMIHADTAQEILTYLERFEYGTLRHTLFALLWDTGIRIGAARALNVADFSKDGKYVALRHRPEQDTPLKNGDDGERDVNLHSWCANIIEDYIEGRRNNVTDEYGNEPLFATSHGRAHRTTLRKHMTALTRPCYYSDECPHDRDKEACEATQYVAACKCPSSVSPHPIRRSSITNWLNEGYSKELLSDRMDVSVKVLEEHYDARSEEEKRELRRDMLDIE